MECWRTMTFRWQLMSFQVAMVVVLGCLDSWISAVGPFALMIAGLILAPGLVWTAAAPSARAAWWTAVADTVALAGCVLLSRVLLTHGPAAPIVDWFAPYAAVTMLIHLVAMATTRTARWSVWLSLLPTVLITPLWLAAAVVGQGEGGQGASPRSVQPLISAWRVTQTLDEECGQDGALCESAITVADATPHQIQTQLHRAGWTSWCQPNTGILSSIGFLDYGQTCVTITGTDATHIDILGKATWWVQNNESR